MDYESIRIMIDFLSGLHNQDFVQKIEIFIIAWFFIRRTIAGHFVKIETGLMNVADQVKELGGALRTLESSHSLRITSLEKRVQGLETQPNQGV